MKSITTVGLLIVTLICVGCGDGGHPIEARSDRFQVLEEFAPQYQAVLDEETGLVWARRVKADRVNWPTAVDSCYNYIVPAFDTQQHRWGWRLPKIEELGGLFHDVTQRPGGIIDNGPKPPPGSPGPREGYFEVPNVPCDPDPSGLNPHSCIPRSIPFWSITTSPSDANKAYVFRHGQPDASGFDDDDGQKKWT